MRIGITTIHRIFNSGSALQAYALQRCISKLGCDCEVIDYVYPNSYHRGASSCTDLAKVSTVKRVKEAVAALVTRKRTREKRFDEFLSEHLHLSRRRYETMDEVRREPPLYDAYVTGSDQVWNPRYMRDDPTFLLEFAPSAAGRIAYAASFGDSRIDPCYAELYQRNLRTFRAISVREAQGVPIVFDLIGERPLIVLDPTMLLPAAEWESLAVAPKLRRKYILCYFLSYAFNPWPYADRLAEHIRKVTGYELVYLDPPIEKAFMPQVRAVYDAGPREFLGWLANAEIVLTTSFHGTAFAANFNRPFLSLVDDVQTLDCRQLSLLNEIHLQGQLLRKNSPLPERPLLYPDFAAANKKLENARGVSLEFLRKALQL
jgi:hypothetical protein